jgi:hypothetical protein
MTGTGMHDVTHCVDICFPAFILIEFTLIDVCHSSGVNNYIRLHFAYDIVYVGRDGHIKRFILAVNNRQHRDASRRRNQGMLRVLANQSGELLSQQTV